MKVIVSLASMFTCLAVHAQLAGTLNRLPDGQDEVRIRNNSSGQLVAFAVTAKQVPWETAASTAPLVIYADPLIDSAIQPVAAAEERVVMRWGGTIWAARGSSSSILNHPL